LFSLFFIHSDAPALSTDQDTAAVAAVPNAADSTTPDGNDAGEQWDDEALAATMTRKGAAVASTNTAELLDMKAFDSKRNESGDIAEKLRVEETKAQLAAAKAGMEKEAIRLKEEREMKVVGKATKAEPTGGKPRFGAAAGMMGGGKWVPPQRRAGGSLMDRPFGMGMGGGGGAKVDTQDETLFPDLASADALIKQQKLEGSAYSAPKKTPVGGGATWGNRPKLNLKKKPAQSEAKAKSEPKPEEKKAEKEAVSEPPPSESAPAPEPAEPAAAPKQPIKPKKKKKKDLSSFKAS
jgi:hypothetical protein